MRQISDKEVKAHLSRILEEIELLKKEAQRKGLEFSALTEQELVKKIRRKTSKSPCITMQMWTSGTSPGSSASYSVYMANPDPSGYYPMFVSVFFGVANFLDDIGQGLASRRDANWPYISSEPFSLGPLGITGKTFNYVTPSGAALGTYLGNSILWRGQWHDKGTYFDRGLFYVTLH